MNTSTKILSSALLAIASLSAASAFAADSDFPGMQTNINTASTTTRAEVRAELMQAKRDGAMIQNNHDYPVVTADQSTGKTRDQVKAELNAALHNGYSVRIDRSYPDAG